MGLVSLYLSGDSETAGKTFKSTEEKRHCGRLVYFKNCVCECGGLGEALKVCEPYN